MSSPSIQPQTEEPSPVKRLACDRCHDQKLRCTRPQEGETCVRCQRAGVLCNVSLAQRTGRPRKSSNNQPKPERTTGSNASGSATRSSSQDVEKRTGIVRANSTESMRAGGSASMTLPDTSMLVAWDLGESALNHCSSASSSFPTQPYDQPMSTDEYADLLECITDQAYFDNMDLSDFSDCMTNPFGNLKTPLTDT